MISMEIMLLNYCATKKKKDTIITHYLKILNTNSKMATLSRDQAIALIKQPKNKAQIIAAIKHEERLRLHAEPFLDSINASQYYLEFIKWVQSFLSKDKFERFKQLMSLPVPTVELTESIFTELHRALEGDNAFSKFEFTKPENEQDFVNYLQEIKNFAFWRNQGFKAMKTAINSFIIVDLPAVQAEDEESPAPYYYLLNIRNVVDADVNCENNAEYIAFCIAENKEDESKDIAFFDDEFYRVFNVKNDNYTVKLEVAHNLGYCPARPFWTTTLNDRDHLQKRSPITNSLGRLDKALFWDVSIEYYETYGVFPIYWGYEQKCTYKDELGNQCEDGYIRYMSGTMREGSTDPIIAEKRCPACDAKKLTGPGTFISVPAPSMKDEADLRDPVGMVSVDVPALEFVTKKHELRKDNIFYSCVGTGGEPINDQAVNEKQVNASFESKQNVLSKIKKNFEMAETWTLSTLARLKYGDSFRKATVSYGDKFYLQSEQEATDNLKNAKSSGLPMYEIADAREEVTATKYKNNPDLRMRAEILANLEPYPDLTLSELTNLSKQIPGLVSNDELILKANFSSFIKRFEREELNVLQFGKDADFATKINQINKTLLAYAKERTNSIAPNDGAANQGAAIQATK